MIDKTQDPADVEAMSKALCSRFPMGVPAAAYREDALAVLNEYAALRRPSPASPAPQGLDLDAIECALSMAREMSYTDEQKGAVEAAGKVLIALRAAPGADTREAAYQEAVKCARYQELLAKLGEIYGVDWEDSEAMLRAAALAPVASPPAPWTRSRTDIQSYDGDGEPVVFLYPPDESKERIAVRGADCQKTADRLLAAINGEY